MLKSVVCKGVTEVQRKGGSKGDKSGRDGSEYQLGSMAVGR
jgi:hypothetical protein